MSSTGLTLYEYVKVFKDSNFNWDLALDNKCPSMFGFEDICGENQFGSQELCKQCWNRTVENTKN
jgi:hypothetical protein